MRWWIAPAALLVVASPVVAVLTIGSEDTARLRIGLAIGCTILLALMAALLMIVVRKSQASAAEADRRAADLMEEMISRRNAEVAFRTSEARLVESQTIAALGSWEWDPVRDDIVWSDMLFRLFGYEPGQITPTFDFFLKAVHPDDRPLVLARMDAAAADELPYEFDFRIVRPDGSIRVLHAKAVLDRDDEGRPIRWRGTDQDVTDRVRHEEERRRLDDRLRSTQRWESLGQLAGGVAHDFNNLMAGVLGNASLARELLPADSPVQEMLVPIEQAAHHTASLCQQLLTFAGKGASSRGAFDPRAILNETRDLIRLGMPKTVELRIDTTADLPMVEGDRSQLKQVLLNLVWNAVEALGPAGGVIEVQMGSSRGGCCTGQSTGHYCSTLGTESFVWLDVRDTGSGIPPHVLARLFDPFFTTKELGRGLGLSSVAGIVRSHGGVVCVTSRPGFGTNMRVYLAALDDSSSRHTPPPVQDTPREIAQPETRWQSA